MKKITLVVLMLVTVPCLLCFSQNSSAQQNRGVIEIAGAKLHLGMTKGEVTDKLAGNTLTKEKEDFWVVAPRGTLGPALQFTNGRLTYASRNWTTYDNDIAEALFGAINSLNQEGFSTCKVFADMKLTPIQRYIGFG